MNDFSAFLFAQPSFTEGIARILDLGGALNEYNSSIDATQANRLAFRADLMALRQDFENVQNKMQVKLVNVGEK